MYLYRQLWKKKMLNVADLWVEQHFDTFFIRPLSIATISIRLVNAWKFYGKNCRKAPTNFAIMSSISNNLSDKLVFQLVDCLAGGEIYDRNLLFRITQSSRFRCDFSCTSGVYHVWDGIWQQHWWYKIIAIPIVISGMRFEYAFWTVFCMLKMAYSIVWSQKLS